MGFDLFWPFRQPVRDMVQKRTLRSVEEDWSIRLPLKGSRASTTRLRIGIFCHIYYVTLAEELLSKVALCPFPFRLVVTTDSIEKQREIAAVLKQLKIENSEIRIVPNRGRDIAPRLIACRDLYTDCDLLLFIHSKNTTQLAQRADWRRWLIESTCGSPDIFRSIVRLFENDDSLGLVYPQTYPLVRPGMIWAGVFLKARALCARMGFDLKPFQKLDFPAGSMYWVRSKAIMPLVDLNLKWEDFPEENGQVHGTLAHIIERVTNHVCEAAGYRWVKVLSENAEPTGRVVKVKSQDELAAFLRKHDFRLLNRAA